MYAHYDRSITSRHNYEEDAWPEKYFKFLRQVKMQCSDECHNHTSVSTHFLGYTL